MIFSRPTTSKVVVAFLSLVFVTTPVVFAQAIRPITVAESLIRVDDSGSERARLGFRISFFGINYDSVWVNNNGNLTFNNALSTYTPYMIQQNSLPMFAPFFADVDTRTYGDVTRYGTGTLEITPGNTRNIFCINWINVGCYALSNSAIANSFQLIIIDRSDIAPGDFDLEYNYDKVTWEAGTASGGNSSGLGGSTTASMGWSNGTTAYYSHAGSLQAGAFLDAGPRSLINNRLNSTVNGRYCFFIRNGVVVDLLGPQTFSVRETARPLTVVGRANTTTFYPRDSVTFSIVPPVLPEFTIAADSSGIISIGATTRLDYETRTRYTFNVVATFRGYFTTVRDTALMTVDIINVEPEQFLRDTSFTISETAAPGAAVGTIIAPLVSNPRFELAGVPGDFTIDPTGSLTVSPAVDLDYARQSLYLLTVIGRYINVTDTLYDTATITVNITAENVLRPPVANAGPDKTITAGPACSGVDTLNGRSSYDPDGGSIASFTWILPAGAGTVTGPAPIVTLPRGNNQIILMVIDEEGSSDTDTVIVTVIDRLAPNVPVLPDVRSECSVTLTAPTTTDNCDLSAITGTTTDPVTYNTPGTDTVTWRFTDEDENSSIALQRVIIEDVTAPVPSIPVLDPITRACSVTINEIDRPTALDNCVGTIIAKTIDPLVYTTRGTYTVRWIYTDLSGNSATQEQSVTVTTPTPPVPDVASLPNINAACSATLAAPTATDFCSGERIIGTTAARTFSSQGTFNIQWTFIDGAGNSTVQPQTVIIHDGTAPTIAARPDTTVYIPGTSTGKIVTLPLPAANDACLSTTVSGRRLDSRPLGEEFPDGTTTVWWKACDANSNCDSISQRVIVRRNRIPTITVLADTTADEGTTLRFRVTAHDTDGTAPQITAANLPAGAAFADSGNGTGIFNWNIGCSGHGVFTVRFTASDGIDSVGAPSTLTIRDLNFAPRFQPMNDTTLPENRALSMLVRTEDCDGDAQKIRAVSIPAGSTFKDNGDGTASLYWTPECDDNGFYIVVFETTDDHTAVRDTVIVQITDVNCFKPEMVLSAVDLTSGVNLPLSVTVHATDRDGGIPALVAANLPTGAKFTADGSGNAVLSWTPSGAGTYKPVITAIDDAESTVRVDTTVTFRITDQNFTGPSFRPCGDTIIEENQQLLLTVAADDPDHTTPALSGLALPPGATFIDNGNGSGKLSWIPGCAMHGSYYFKAQATDGTLCDTLTVQIVVRDNNCPPVINPVTGKNIAYGSTLRFSVSAVDPDGDVVPDLSVSCALPGYTFTVPDKGHGTFEWNATYTSGTYAVTFFASDGELTDTETVAISVNKTGTLHIVTEPASALIFSSPAPSLPGALLGTGSASITGVPGTYWFGARAPGYRQSTFTGTITPDAACTLRVALRSSIPCMFAAAESVSIGASTDPGVAGSIAFVDFDHDGIQDLSIAGGRKITVFTGSDTSAGVKYRTPGIAINVPATADSIIAHTYADWNNDGRYECILSTTGGKIRVAHFDNEDLLIDNVVVERAGETLFPTITDVNGDRKKDLVVVSQGKGAYLYLNSGTDIAPVFASPATLTDTAAAPVTGLSGNLLLTDVDGDGTPDLIAKGSSHLQLIVSSSGDSTLLRLPAGEDLNAGGARVAISSGTSCALLLLPKQLPRLAVVTGNRISEYRLRLLGDVTADGIVNIADISKIGKAWELTDKNPAWNPPCNIRLSPAGDEVIDIKDISKASKNWELQE